jgi:ABC-type sugar transport system ATPase subunit
VEARIEAAEMTGPDLYARLAVHGHSLTARWPAETPVSIGQSLTVHFDMRHANYFDPQTEQLIA